MSMIKGLGNLIGGSSEFIAFEEGKPKVLLFIDWYEDLVGVREHYEPNLDPKYIRCAGDGCPLCAMNPEKPPQLKIKFRVFDADDGKIKIVSLAKKHIKSIHNDFTLDEIDPTKEFVTVIRNGKSVSDTAYKARRKTKDIPKIPANLEDLVDDSQAYYENLIKPATIEYVQSVIDKALGKTQAQPVQQEDDEQPQAKPKRALPF
jgi:hypothetical protein